ncbi:hypothetical protein [Paenibacillus beijingensis]|uniref:Uncharacterized protein n=1 Tax=Paenibacillus beijingensis TaxID=1126833 RepID=A0A0D5NG81_9BACL|nr:hypothetical protein [Paenibacillus beijingensis]AJY74266.1 hypothetical protein VN24_06330 [Paenibacillus beijingensis]
MLTIVVHYDETPQDWNLIERFFHMGIHSGKLALFRHQANRNAAYQYLVNKVYEYLNVNMVEKWQLVWMMNISQEKDYRKRLSSQLGEFRKSFLSRLQDRKLSPEKVFVLALDGIDREEGGAPLDDFLRDVWTLDIHGYLPRKPLGDGNLFYLGEIEALDASWDRSALDLRQAGPLEEPTESFLQLLRMQVDKVKISFREILADKRKIEQQYACDPGSVPTDVLFENEIRAVEEGFYERINRIMVPPLSPKLNEYLPSHELKAVLKELMGTKVSIASYVFIRVPYPQEFAARRVRTLLKVAYAINAIALNDPVSRLWQEGNAYTLDVAFRERDLASLFNRYITRLYICKSRIEDSLRNRRLDMAPDYAPWTSLPHGREALEEMNVPLPKLRRGRYLQFEQQFRIFEDEAREMMNKRDQRVLYLAKEGMRKLDIQKKLKEEPQAFTKEEPEEIIRRLQEEIAVTRQELLAEVPHTPSSLSAWNDYMEQTKQDISFQLRSMPGARQIGWITFIIGGALLAPAFVKWNDAAPAAGTGGLHPVLVYGVYPAAAAAAVALCLRLSRNMIFDAVKRRSRRTEKRLDEMIVQQDRTQKQYNDYLNRLYKLLKLTQRTHDVSRLSSEKAEENLRLRFHQTALEEAIDIGKRLAYLLNIGVKEDQGRSLENWYDEQSWFDRDATAHPVYCPLWEQPGVEQDGDAAAELVVGLSRDTIKGALIYPAERVICEHDRVYRL